MTRSDDLFKGVAIGVGLVVLTPLVIATLAPVVKPVMRSALKAGIRTYEKGRENLELFNETVDDIIAEVEDEMSVTTEQQEEEEPVVTAVHMTR